jgi:hypothetical protein
MKSLRCLTLLAGGGLLAGALAFLGLGGAQAEPEYQVKSLQNNPKIKCMPAANNRKQLKQYKVAQEFTNVLKQQHHKGCIECHQSKRPKYGQGDRPQVNAATALLQNTLHHPIKYELRMGQGEWQAYELKPKEIRPVTYKYKSKKEKKKHQSPKYKVRYEMDGKKQEKDLTLVATPKQELGNLYYFTASKKNDQLELKTPKKPVYRGKKKK